MTENKRLTNPIDEYIEDSGNQKPTFSELFEVDDIDLDTKTDLSREDIKRISALYVTDEFLVSKGLKRVFKVYYEKYMRLLISLERKSRAEFVDVNKSKKDEFAQGLGESLGGLIKK